MDGRFSLVVGQVKAKQIELENESRTFLLDLTHGDIQARTEEFHEHMMSSYWKFYWHLHAEFQSGYIHYGTQEYGYPKWVLDQTKFGDWAKSYPGDPTLP